MTDMTVAKTILQQLGGNRFIAMTGAKQFVGDKDKLIFKIPRANGITHVKITLNPLDYYEMEFIRVHGMKTTVVKKVDMVYFDGLQQEFTEATGLYTHL